MSRPPATDKVRYTATDGSTSGGSTAWPQLSPGPGAAPLTNIGTRGALHLQGIFFEAAGTFVSIPVGAPAGATNISQAVPQWAFFSELPGSIDPTTTALPFVLYYGPLGPGGR
jgi:hypothetical protein